MEKLHQTIDENWGSPHEIGTVVHPTLVSRLVHPSYKGIQPTYPTEKTRLI